MEGIATVGKTQQCNNFYSVKGHRKVAVCNIQIV